MITAIKMENFKKEMFMFYCYHNNFNAVKWCLENGSQVNTKNQFGETGFMLACRHKKTSEILKLLLNNKKVKVNSGDIQGSTGFMIACERNNIEAVKLLLDSDRVKVNLKDCVEYGRTGFYIACEKNNIEIINLLVKNEKVNCDLKTKYSIYNDRIVRMNNYEYTIIQVVKYNIKNSIKINIDFNIN